MSSWSTSRFSRYQSLTDRTDGWPLITSLSPLSSWWNKALCYFQMGSQYQRSVPLEVRRAEGERVRAKHPDKIPVGTSLWLFCPFQMFKFIPKAAIWLKLWEVPFVFCPVILYFLCRLWTTILFICFFTDHRGASCEVTSTRSGQKEISGALRLNRWKHGL